MMRRGNICFLLILLISLPINAFALTLFSDNFNDGDTVGWTFYGANTGAWSASGSALSHNAPGGYTGQKELALIDGITTPGKFSLEADVSVISSINGSDWGHVGLVWGVTDLTGTFPSVNTSYIRTHQDRVTSWSTLNGVSLGEQYLNATMTNGLQYHLKVEVDYLARMMTVFLDSNSIIFSGTSFDRINQNTGGGIGLISWKDNITFDNVVLSVPDPVTSVPEPSTWLLLSSGLAGLAWYGRMRKKA